MKLLTAGEMRTLDSICIRKFAIPSFVLMENAGRAVAGFIAENFSLPRRVYIFCGPGNNGGDGLVVARYLYNKGCGVTVFLVGEKKKITADAALNFKIASHMGIQIKEIAAWEEFSFDKIDSEKQQPILVDALLGTGAKGAPRDIFARIIDFINTKKGVKVAIDIPSGVDADTGEVIERAVKADYTVTFAYPKRGLYLYPGIDYSGKIEIVDIGIPCDIIKKEKMHIPANLLLAKDFPSDLFRRAPSSHKGTFGHLFVLAGSCGLTGAAILTCMGALKVSPGLITLGIPLSLNSIVEIKLTEVMSLPLAETNQGTFSMRAFEKISHFARKCQALVLGPGISMNSETGELVRKILQTCNLPIVLDADAINALAGDTGIIKNYEGPLVLTPHPGELARAVGVSVSEVQGDRIKAAVDLASSTGKIVVLKGAGTIIATPEGSCWVNTTGNPGMAAGGSGDVLAGIIGGFLAQGVDILTSTKLGVYIHGLAADFVVKKQRGLTILTAQDIVKNLIHAIRSLHNEYY